jgi:hypothetical protein
MQKPKLVSLLEQSKRRQVVAGPTTDIAAIVMAGQTAMADVITRNFSGEIKDQVCAECDAIKKEMAHSLIALVERHVKEAVADLPVPERVIERIVERVEAKEDAEEESEPPMVMTVQRKDGMIDTVKQGGKTFDVIRNKQGFIKEVRERA